MGHELRVREFLDRWFGRAGGALAFEDFMAAALYDPECGYYTTGIGDVGGERGDFATAATLSGGLGRAIAAWIGEEAAFHGWRGTVAVIEVGGGNGALAASVLKALGWRGRRRIRYHLVEVSPVLQGMQRKRLGRAATWHETIVEALQNAGGKALIFSNELADAFPAKWLRQEGGKWREIFVAFDAAGGLREIFREFPADLNRGDYSAMAMNQPNEGQRIEILPSYRSWLADLAASWTGGSMLTIDYGAATAEAVYADRPDGTMRAYYRHQRIEGGGVYARFGRQDLTSDVNFADLAAWGEALGFQTVRLGTQREFLARFGATDDRMAGDGAGTAFLALEQRRTDLRLDSGTIAPTVNSHG